MGTSGRSHAGGTCAGNFLGQNERRMNESNIGTVNAN